MIPLVPGQQGADAHTNQEYANAFAQQIAQGIAQAFAPQFAQIGGAIKQVCDKMDQNGGGGGEPECNGSTCTPGKPCKGGTNCKCKNGGGQPTPPAVPFSDEWSALMGALSPNCVMRCRKLDPCLLQYWQFMLTRVSGYTLYNILQTDDDVVTVKTSVGGTGYINFPTNPLAADQKALLTQSAGQKGPFQAGCIKVSATWLDGEVPELVTVRTFVGPKGLTNIASVNGSPAGLVEVGQPKPLSMWKCIDKCFILPWPKFLGCLALPIPDTEAVYVELAMDAAAGASKIKAIDYAILKASTDDCNYYLSKCNLGGC